MLISDPKALHSIITKVGTLLLLIFGANLVILGSIHRPFLLDVRNPVFDDCQRDTKFIVIFYRTGRVVFGPGLAATIGKFLQLFTGVVLMLPPTIGEQHRKQRKMLNPVFATSHLREMGG